MSLTQKVHNLVDILERDTRMKARQELKNEIRLNCVTFMSNSKASGMTDAEIQGAKMQNARGKKVNNRQ